MVKNRKPLFVSEEALQKLFTIAKEEKCFAGDVVDILLGIKTREQLSEEFIGKELHARRVGRLPTKSSRGDTVVDSSSTHLGGSN